MDLKEQNKILAEAIKKMDTFNEVLIALNEIKQGLEQHKSQLIDGGAAECSVLVHTINHLIKKCDVRK